MKFTVVGVLAQHPPELAQLMLEATDELLNASVISDAKWSALSDVMTRHQLMDLVFVVGTYALLAMAFESFGFIPEPGLAPLPDA